MTDEAAGRSAAAVEGVETRGTAYVVLSAVKRGELSPEGGTWGDRRDDRLRLVRRAGHVREDRPEVGVVRVNGGHSAESQTGSVSAGSNG